MIAGEYHGNGWHPSNVLSRNGSTIQTALLTLPWQAHILTIEVKAPELAGIFSEAVANVRRSVCEASRMP
jgi:hypothetical protein